MNEQPGSQANGPCLLEPPHQPELGAPWELHPSCPHQAWRSPSPALGLLPQAAVSSGRLSNFPMSTPLWLPRPWASLGRWPSFQTRQGSEPNSTSVGRQAGPTMPAPGSPQPKSPRPHTLIQSPHVPTYTVLLSHHELGRHAPTGFRKGAISVPYIPSQGHQAATSASSG